MHYLLSYELKPEYHTRRTVFLNAHLIHCWSSVDRGELLLGGPVGAPSESGLLLFRADSPTTVETFARTDPYVLNGLIASWSVKIWHTGVGREASHPKHPS